MAARKRLTVKQALSNGRWMTGLQRFSSEDELDQFVPLWNELQTIRLNDDRDKVTWKLTADGKYSASSAYAAQFHGRIRQPHLQKVWTIRAEGKVKFFIWLMLRNRNWTAERLRARGLPHDERCSLCDQEYETAAHLALHCPFTKEVWAKFRTSHPKAFQCASSSRSLNGWWAKIRRGSSS